MNFPLVAKVRDIGKAHALGGAIAIDLHEPAQGLEAETLADRDLNRASRMNVGEGI